MANRQRCACGYMIVPGVGDPKSEVRVLRDFPDFEEQKDGALLKGLSADVLRAEFNKAGMSLGACYVTCLYPHVWSDTCEVDYVDQAARMFKNYKKVLLMGTEAVYPFFGKNAIDLCGVWQKHQAFPGVKFMPCITPGNAAKDDLGEFRLALSRFSK